MVQVCIGELEKRNRAKFGDSELPLASTFAKCFPRFRVCGESWFEFSSPRWTQVNKQRVMGCFVDELNPLCGRTLEELKRLISAVNTEQEKRAYKALSCQLLKLQKHCFTKAGLFTLLHLVALFTDDATLVDKLDSNPALLAFEDGVWDFSLNAFRQGMPEDYISKSMGYPFPCAPPSPEAMKDLHRFLRTIYCDDRVLHYVLAHLYRSLDGRNAESSAKLFLLTGTEGSGKIALLQVFQAALGGQASTSYAGSIPISMICKKNSMHTMAESMLLSIKGKRMVYAAAEPYQGELMNNALVNQLTGGEDLHTFSPDIGLQTFTCQFSLWIAANDLLRVDSGNLGLRQRFNCLRHRSTFLSNGIEDTARQIFSKDRPLFKRVQQEPSALCHHLFHTQWGFEQPDLVREWSARYLNDDNPV